MDAELITLAERVVRLARRDRDIWDRRAAIDDAVDAEMPPLPDQPEKPVRGTLQEVEADGMRITTMTVPTTLDPTYAAALAAYDAAVAERNRLEAEMEARLGYPRLEKLSKRTFARLVRWAERLALMEPQTQAGLKAKAEAHGVLIEAGNDGDWVTAFAGSVSRDALRIIGAEADVRGQEDQARDGELLAVGRLWEKSRERDDHAHRRLVEAEERYDAPLQPEALFFDPERDPPVLGAHSIDHIPSDRRWYGHSSAIRALRKPWHYAFCLARRDEILAAYDTWTAADATERERAGIPEARAEVDASVSENAALRAAICRLPAYSPAGVDLKVRVIVWLHDDIDTLAREMRADDLEDPEFASSLAMSLALDLARGGIGLATSVAPAADLASAA